MAGLTISASKRRSRAVQWLSSLARPSRARPGARPSDRKIVFESLERRDLLSADASWFDSAWGNGLSSDLVRGGEGELTSTDIVRYRLALTDTLNQPLPTDASGNPIVTIGQTVRLHGYSQDTRYVTPVGGNPIFVGKGVYASYMDVFYTNADLISVRTGETQLLQFVPDDPSSGQTTPPPISGSFKLTFDIRTTAPITYSPIIEELAIAVQDALEALPNIGRGNVHVSGDVLQPESLRVQFVNNLAQRDLPEITIDSSGMVNCKSADISELYPADPSSPGAFRSAFTPVYPFINGLRVVDKDPEPGQPSGGKSFGGIGTFSDEQQPPPASVAKAEREFFYVDLRADAAGQVAFSGNPSNYDESQFAGTETLVFPTNASNPEFVVEPQYQGFVQDLDNPLTLTILPRNVFVVNSLGDAPDANPGDGTCATASGVCTLRAAIQTANATPNLGGVPDLITFDLPGPGPYKIQPTSQLPTITQPVVIDGTTQLGYKGTPLIELDGAAAGSAATGIRITAGGSTIRGLVVNRFKGWGVSIETLGGNALVGNYIGTDPTGMQDRGNESNGVFINSGNNTIGGAFAEDGNLISGNDARGIYLVGAGAKNNRVLGNRIGTNALGTAALPNSMYGVWIASADNQIGGARPGEGNLISGNASGGVLVVGPDASGNVIEGNKIGTNSAGAAKLANTGAGILLSGAPNNRVGGTIQGAGNLVSGNARQGIYVLGSTGRDNTILGNRVGTNADGTAAVGNTEHGVYVTAANTRIGGALAGEGNLISGNGLAGVAVFFSAATGNSIQGNRIGTNADGTAAIGNGAYGVDLRLSGLSLVGGTSAAAGNVISGNGGAGVLIAGDTAKNNSLQNNRIGTNASGTASVGNQGTGVFLTSKASNNVIGGAGTGNVISGNTGRGIYILGDETKNNTIQGNRIGTNAAGTAAVPNGLYGVWIAAKDNVVGGAAAGQGNVISGNTSGGVYVSWPWSGSAGSGNRFQSNKIGVGATGGALGNQGAGVLVTTGATNNTVGGAGVGNEIAYNTRQGVYVIGQNSTGNALTQNSIHDNGGAADLGIDLSPYGRNANDADDLDYGPNRLQNYPEMSAAVLNGGNLSITYAVPSSVDAAAYPLTVEFFVADANAQEGQTYLGQHSYASPGTKTAVLAQCCIAVGARVVATATDKNGNTSEFSTSIQVTAAVQAPPLVGGDGSVIGLDAERLALVVPQAIDAWESAGLDAARVSVLQSLTFEIVDLPESYLGLAASDRIVLDATAAGFGWHTDGGLDTPPPVSQVDLLTVVIHEMGHILGLVDADHDDGLMGGVLRAGVRHLPTADEIDQVLAIDAW